MFEKMSTSLVAMTFRNWGAPHNYTCTFSFSRNEARVRKNCVSTAPLMFLHQLTPARSGGLCAASIGAALIHTYTHSAIS